MTSLVERLREGVSIEPTFAECRDANNLMDEAADTIEAMQAALQGMVDDFGAFLTAEGLLPKSTAGAIAALERVS